MSEIINTKIISSSKGPRLWVEGVKLGSNGFVKGESYSRVVSGSSIILKSDPEGKYKVSGKSRNGQSLPIIDLCGKWLDKLYSVNDLVTAKIDNGVITIKLHHEGMALKDREKRLLSKEKLSEGALCYGIGVSAHAISKSLEDSNIDSTLDLAMELETKYLQVANKNNEYLGANTKIFQGKIEECNPEEIPTIDILSLSLPCTGHSPQGKTKNAIKKAEEHSSDATAIFGAMKVIYKSNPSIIISENVVQAKDSATYILFKSELRRLGYEVFETTLDHTHSNALEKRKRYWFVAISKNVSKGFSLDSLNNIKIEKRFRRISDVIKEGESSYFSSQCFKKREEINKKAGRGFKCNFVTGRDEFVNVIPRNYTKRQVSNPHYLNPENQEEVRLFSPREHALIKGIPPHLVKEIAATTAHEGLGQSILYSHAYLIANLLAYHIKELRRQNTIKKAS
ncbi:MAG: hypothetical protein GY909_15620 [Oligoflexia bacterium]|nr:hypothetical protein [Oligoflexia bacterium]